MRNPITLLLAVFLLCLTTTAVAQDVILKKDNSTVLSKVIEVTGTEIKYKKWSNQDGPTYSISRSEVTRINYQNGDVDTFNDNIVTAPNPQPTVTVPEFQTPQPQPETQPKVESPKSPYSRSRVQFSLNGGVAIPMGKFGTTSDEVLCAPAFFGGDELETGYGAAKTGFIVSVRLHIPAYKQDKDIVGIPIKISVLHNGISDVEKKKYRSLFEWTSSTINEQYGVYGYDYQVTRYPKYTNISLLSGVDYTHYFTKAFGLFAEACIGLNVIDIAYSYAKNLKGGTLMYVDYSNHIQYYSPDAMVIEYKPKVNFAYEIGVGLFVVNHISLGLYYSGYSPFQVCPNIREVSQTYQMEGGSEGDDMTAPKLQSSALSIQLGVHF
jgi:hypothetical protein